MNIAVILSGGTGQRFKSIIPKQYQMLCGREVISYSVEAFKKSTVTDRIIIVAAETELKKLSEKYDVECIAGGKTRNESLYNALNYIHTTYSCERVLIHEAARPFIYDSLIDEYFMLLNEYDAVITAQHITDSLGKEGQHVVDRSMYYLIQAPEAFRFSLLLENFSAESEITATAQQLPADTRTKRYFDFKNNFKITLNEDLMVAETLMKLGF